MERGVGRSLLSTTRVTISPSSRPTCFPNFQKSVIQPIKLWVEESEAADPFAALGALDASFHPRLRDRPVSAVWRIESKALSR